MFTVQKGMKEKGWLEYKYPQTNEAIRFPVGVIQGAFDGPTLAVVGGTHGSEYCGIEGAIRLFNSVDPAKLHGTLYVGMIYNFPAFKTNTGFLVPQDGINPGRTFPGKLDGSFSEVMAYHWWTDFLSKADYYVELHGGDIPEALVPFVYSPQTGDESVDAKIRGMADVFNIGIVVRRKIDVKSPTFRSAFIEMAAKGIPSILTESGQQGILNIKDADVHVTGLKNVMIHLGMLEGEIVKTVKIMFSEEHLAVRSEHIGMWYPSVSLGDWKKGGEVVGDIRDYFGDHIADVLAPFDGHVTVIRTSPNTAVGNVLIEMDRVTSREE
jgi:predicted deacylase